MLSTGVAAADDDNSVSFFAAMMISWAMPIIMMI
jgi:hypothetical protein